MNAIKTHSGSLSLRRHYPEQVIRVSLSFDLKIKAPLVKQAMSLYSRFLSVNCRLFNRLIVFYFVF